MIHGRTDCKSHITEKYQVFTLTKGAYLSGFSRKSRHFRYFLGYY
jgi:hypothetical protein